MTFIQLKKVLRAVKAFNKLVTVSDKFEDAMNELNEAEEAEFTKITGAKLEPKKTVVPEDIKEAKPQ